MILFHVYIVKTFLILVLPSLTDPRLREVKELSEGHWGTEQASKPNPRYFLLQHMAPMEKAKKWSSTQMRTLGKKILIPLYLSHWLWLSLKHIPFHKYLSRDLIPSVDYEYIQLFIHVIFFLIFSEFCLMFLMGNIQQIYMP